MAHPHRTSPCSSALGTLDGSPAILDDLVADLPQDERFSYVFEGNSQTLDGAVAHRQRIARVRKRGRAFGDGKRSSAMSAG